MSAKSPDRFLICVNKDCDLKSMNRDENGAKNIGKVGLSKFYPVESGQRIPENMDRKKKLTKPKLEINSTRKKSRNQKHKHKELKKARKQKSYENSKQHKSRVRVNL